MVGNAFEEGGVPEPGESLVRRYRRECRVELDDERERQAVPRVFIA